MSPLFLFAVGMTIYQISVIHQQQADQAAVLAENLVLRIDNVLNSRIHALNMLAMSPLVDNPSRWAELYLEAEGFYHSFGTHVVISDGGTPAKLLLDTRVPFGTKLPVVKKPNGRFAGPIAMRTGKPAVSDLFSGPVAQQPLVGIAVPVLREGQAKLAIVTIIGRQFFQKRLDHIVLPTGWSMLLKDAEGETIASRLPAPTTDPGLRFSVHSQVSGWAAVVEIPRNTYWGPILWAAAAFGATLLGVTLAGFLGGNRVGRRLGRAVASLTETPVPGTPSSDILEIAAARQELDEETARRAAVEGTLRDSQEDLREKMLEYGAMFERSVVGKAQADPLTGRFLMVNQAFADMTGYLPEELYRLTFTDITVPDDRQRDLQTVERVAAGKADSWHIEKRCLRNALKHAFAGRGSGQVRVSLRADDQGKVQLCVRDDGIGLPPEFDWRTADSLGLRLVQMLARQLHAGVEVTAANGTEWTIAFAGPQP